MKIFSASQTREWDAYTIENEPIDSIALMNRAAVTFTDWFLLNYPDTSRPVTVFCGTGNNGGDGVAVARMLHWIGFSAKVVVCDWAAKQSPDFKAQMEALPQHQNIDLHWLKSFNALPNIAVDELLIDALFGSGLNRPLEGEWAQLIDYLNLLPNEVLSIDLPSGLLADAHTPGKSVVLANRTFSFERPKLAFFFPENAERVGDWSFGSIGLHPDFDRKTETPFHYLSQAEARSWIKARPKFSHKGSFGHALLIAGSYGKMGAAILAAKACLRAGTGLLTVHTPRSGHFILQSSVPEAMASADHRGRHWAEVPDIQPYTSVGVGPGIGKDPETALALEQLIRACKKPMVLDADALNLLAENPNWWPFLPKNSILTPHPKEFERLFGETGDDFQRNELQRTKAREYGVYIVLKGAHTAVAAPTGDCWFNSTGNPGMATGGAGDVLTGIITGLLAQGYLPSEAVLLGVYLHGHAGDLAAAELGQQALIAGDLIHFLGKAWKK